MKWRAATFLTFFRAAMLLAFFVVLAVLAVPGLPGPIRTAGGAIVACLLVVFVVVNLLSGNPPGASPPG